MDYSEWMNMSPEEQAKKLEETQKEALEAWNRLSPEEQEKAKASYEKLLEEDAQKHQKILDEAARFQAESGQNLQEPLKDTSEKPTPKFCTNCGSPLSGGKFCTNCGTPIR